MDRTIVLIPASKDDAVFLRTIMSLLGERSIWDYEPFRIVFGSGRVAVASRWEAA